MKENIILKVFFIVVDIWFSGKVPDFAFTADNIPSDFSSVTDVSRLILMPFLISVDIRTSDGKQSKKSSKFFQTIF